MDILQPLPIEQWGLLRDCLKRDWPSYAYYYYLINNVMKWKKKDPQIKLQIFCPNGDVSAGTWVVTSSHSYWFAYIFTFVESKKLLCQVLKETKLIFFRKFSFVCKDRMYTYFKPKEECLQLEVRVPEECELRHLNESHIALVDSLWPYRIKDKSTKYLASTLKFNRGMGLFLKEDGSLVSWILHTECGGLGTLQTVDGHKRKGYAKIVVKAMIKELAAEENHDSFVFVKKGNDAPQKLFESLGYKRMDLVTWYQIKPSGECR